MSQMVEFKEDFVRRTLEILEENYDNTEHEVTLLLNCLLGMVTLPIEEKKDLKNDSIVDKFQYDCAEKLKQVAIDVEPKTIDNKKLFRNIRNSIAHLKIETNSKNNKIETIELKNLSNGNKGRETLKVLISVEQLKIFAEYVATEYLKRFFNNKELLLKNIDKIHITLMDIDRIQKNLKLDNIDVIEFCKSKVMDSNCNIYKQGKNWYCKIDNIEITINSYSYTIITAHTIK